MAKYHMRTSVKQKTIKKGHIQTTLDLFAEYKIDFSNTDRIDKEVIVDRNFTVDYASMTADNDNQHITKGFLTVTQMAARQRRE